MAVPSPTTDFAAYVLALQSALELTTKHASELPGPSDLSFHRSLDRGFARGLDASSARVLGQATRLLSTVAAAGGSSAKSKQKKRRELQDEDDVVDGFQSAVVDVLDEVLEDADSCLDEFTGQKKAAAIEVKGKVDPVKRVLPASHTPTARLPFNLLHDAHLRKPQLDFTPPVDNSNDATWSPTLPEKHHAMTPMSNTSPGTHPYTYESAHIPYPTSMFTQTPAIPAKPFANTPFTFVDTPQALDALITKLQKAKEIAVDLEHHSFRSYSGFVCLMQISTREEDWVVDTLALRNELRETKLGGVMADPSIVKVFHGAESDIVWLQQDFDIYVVNLFDSYHASKVLEFPSFSLASLLSLYCDFTADKRYQMADWRIRPIPEDMLFYARSDTHFLLYIYDNLRNSLLSRSAPASPLHPSSGASTPQPQASMRAVLERSEKTALKLYARERYDTEKGLGGGGWASLLRKAGRSMAVDLRKLEIFKAIHGWRDSVARAEDESPHYLMPNHQLFTLTAKQAQTPAEILSYAKPLSPMMRKRVHELARVISDAMKKPITAPAPPPAVVSAPAPVQATTPVGRKLNQSLWEPKSGLLKTAGSGLFGMTLKAKRKDVGAAKKAESSLFGARTKIKSVDSPSETQSLFREVAQRVYTSFIPAPIPVAAPPSPQKAPTEPEQIPFIPAAERKPKDEVVAVGLTKKQRKQKKRTAPVDEPEPRKKSKMTPPGDDSASAPPAPAASSPKKSKGKAKVKPEEIPAFDYSQEPNGLDSFKAAPPTKLARKPKKPKGPIVDTSNFRKPPEDPTGPKAGSRSTVFKK